MSELFDLSGRHVLVTGGANGLGRMMAAALLDAGASVTITSRKDAESAAEELSRHGPCTGVNVDLASPEGSAIAAAAVRAKTDRLHVLINNAGRTWGEAIETYPDKAWTSLMAVNVQSPFNLVRELLPLLEAAGQANDPARILNVGSIAGNITLRKSAFAYAASKAAIHHLTRELAAELAPRRIAANVIVPGWFPTNMSAPFRRDEEEARAVIGQIPLARFGEASDIGGVAVFLSSKASAYITGAEIAVDGGLVGCR
ncbi:SDR family oxidoreductase [soil metagenome]